MTNHLTDEQSLEYIITQAVWKIWRSRPGTHDKWDGMRAEVRLQITHVTKEVMKTIKPYLAI